MVVAMATRCHFNSHAHVERDGEVAEYNLRQRYFNSHAHVERDDNALIFRAENAISTHTLTWSVTIALVDESLSLVISTHTLTWSVTYFYSYDQNWLGISTHTLTWSVTWRSTDYIETSRFQLTRSRGA